MDNLREMMIEHGINYYMDNALAVHERPYPITDAVKLVGFQCGFDMLIVAVRSYLDENDRLDDDEAIEIAEDYLKEIGWLKHETEITVR